ncbi:MAG: alanine racemase [Bacteroidota bacterium]
MTIPSLQTPPVHVNGSGSAVHSTRAVIDLAAFRHNVGVVRRRVGSGVKVMAVLKSNAYGHGVKPIAAEAQRCGVEALAVARVGEGFELRGEGVRTPILVCEIAPPDVLQRVIGEDLQLTVTSPASATAISAAACRMGTPARVHVKVDTGMGRLGVSHAEAGELIEAMLRLPRLELAGVYSHFATSENADRSYAREQLARFNRVLEELERRNVEVPLRHMANTGAIFNLPEAHFDMVRPGIALFGYTPAQAVEGGEELRPVMNLLSRVSHLKQVEKGTNVSYGRQHTTTRRTCIATVPIGYGDGYLRALTHKAEVLIRGTRYPSVGAISMDHLMVDVGEKSPVEVDDRVTLIGTDGAERITCWELAEKLGTIPYEITCLITPRVLRVFTG